MDSKPTRRTFLKVGLTGMAVLVLPAGCVDVLGEKEGAGGDMDKKPAGDRGEGRFFDLHQYETVRAVTGLIIPEDQDVGAIRADVVDYIDYLLGAFTVDPPRIYAAGPFSGRHGGENGFREYLPLTRVKEIAWRNYIEGSQGIHEREFNGPVVGIQTIFVSGVTQLDALSQTAHGVDFVELDSAAQNEIFGKADPDFVDAASRHTIEGMYAAPEYGGNRDMAGWKFLRYEGDRQPVGYSRRQVEEPDSTGALNARQLQEATEFVRRVFAPFEDQLL